MARLVRTYMLLPALLMLFIVFYPFAANLFYTNTEIMDNRPLHEKPVKFTRNYAREFEDYYNDTFAGRKKIISKYVKLQKKLNSACAADERNELISVCRTPGTGNSQKLLVWTDSFAAALQPYLNKSFGTVFYSTAGLKKLSEIEKIVDETKPDLVVDELVERYFSRFANYPRIFGGEYD